jgi:hypothetical protein
LEQSTNEDAELNIIEASVKPVMLAAGVLTSTMVYAAIAPDAALNRMFGASLSGPLAELLVRNWAILIALVGFGLIYGAFRPAARTLALIIAIISKVAFISLVLAYGFGSTSAGVSISIDAAFAAAFVIFLISSNEQTGER